MFARYFLWPGRNDLIRCYVGCWVFGEVLTFGGKFWSKTRKIALALSQRGCQLRLGKFIVCGQRYSLDPPWLWVLSPSTPFASFSVCCVWIIVWVNDKLVLYRRAPRIWQTAGFSLGWLSRATTNLPTSIADPRAVTT